MLPRPRSPSQLRLPGLARSACSVVLSRVTGTARLALMTMPVTVPVLETVPLTRADVTPGHSQGRRPPSAGFRPEV